MDNRRQGMDTKDAFNAKIDAQLKEWSTRIAELKARAELAEASVKVEYIRQVETLRIKREETQAKLEDLKNAGDEAWEILKAGVEQAAIDLKNSINSAVSRFK